MLDIAKWSAKQTSAAAGAIPTGDRRLLGIIPRSGLSRSLAAFGVLNFLLTMLPVWDVVGNSSRFVAGLLPGTVLWSYAAFTLNFVLALVVYVTQFRPWACAIESESESELGNAEKNQ
jgi:hypothetical protein